MRTPWCVALLTAVMVSLLPGCSDNIHSVVSPDNPAATATPSPEKKGPIVHSVQGGFWFDDYGNGKKVQNTITAHQYADGSVDGRYLINAANAFGHDKWVNAHSSVIYMKVYENVLGYEKFAVVGGVETSGPGKGYYEVWWLAVNGPGGHNFTADGFFFSLDPDKVADVWNLPLEELILVDGLAPSPPIDAGSLSIK
ncbi:MAG: hypothetical protein H6R26_2592 [Proteobacteria bacterium]|nr:hypothetical protein [Pseudomonadota bacterium]